MIHYFLTYFLIHWGFIVVAYKYNLPRKIEDFGNNVGIKFIYDLGSCEFCIEHHIGVLLAPLFGLVEGWNWILLAFPFMSASLSNILKSLKR